MEGSFHEILEEFPFWVLRAEVNVWKMPHPLQVLGIAVVFVADEPASTVFVEGVGITWISLNGESYCVFRVSRIF